MLTAIGGWLVAGVAAGAPTVSPGILRQTVPVTTTYLRINWDKSIIAPTVAKDESGDEATPLAQSSKACTQLGDSLLVGGGLWGFGLFDHFGCYSAGQTQKIAGTDPGASQVAWILDIRREGKKLILALSHTQLPKPGADDADAGDDDNKAATAKSVAGTDFVVGAVTLVANDWSQDLLKDRSYAQIVAAMLLDKLPAALRIDGSQSDFVLPVEGDAKTPVKAPTTLTLFTWSAWTDEVSGTVTWMPHVIGTAKWQKGQGWHVRLTETTSSPVYAQRRQGPGHAKKSLQKSLAKTQDSLLNDKESSGYDAIRDGVAKAARFITIDNVAAGFIGFRYGREAIAAASSLLPPTTLYSVLAEFRSGALAGLRVYYDYIPKVPKAYNGDTIYLSWSRLLIGYSFAIPIPRYIDRITITPKIGYWHVSSRLPYLDADGNPAVNNFDTGKALSASLELGLEVETPRLLFRPWYARDVGTPLTKVAGTRYQVISDRYGGDLLIKGPPVDIFSKTWHLDFLLFAYYENIQFSSSSIKANSFNLLDETAFAGGGLSLAW